MMTITTRLQTFFVSTLAVTILLVFLLAPAISTAESTRAGFVSWLAALKKEARDKGIPQTTVDRELGDFKPISRVIELNRNQPETTLSFDHYLSRILSEDRVANGRRILNAKGKLLARIAARYGVQPRFLVALWGVETDFGRVTGSHPVIDALVSLVYDGRRGSFFRKELIHALRILDEGHIPPARMKGSWAGAMGQLQFMPSTFRDFGVDFDGDGRIDIWDSQEDVFASAANYLSRSGWRKGQSWGQEVSLSNGARLKPADFRLQRRLSKWQVLGIKPLQGRRFPSANLPASIVQPDGPKGRTFLVYSNYHVMRRWNHSHNFALSVGILADRIGSP